MKRLDALVYLVAGLVLGVAAGAQLAVAADPPPPCAPCPPCVSAEAQQAIDAAREAVQQYGGATVKP